ncbi:MAG: hypothetical protein GX050_03085 [Firmicutes bacterium]|nr:hypothetical protein [Bacillota bacterium]
MKEGIKALLALILLAGFFELLLPEDGMRKYARMVVGLIVLCSLIGLVLKKEVVFYPELTVAEWPKRYNQSAALVADGLKLRQAGEDKVEAMMAPAWRGSLEEALRRITGVEGIRVEVLSLRSQGGPRVRLVLAADPGLTPATLQRLVAELLAISPEQVEVAKEFADEQ